MNLTGLHETIIKIPWVAMHQCLASIHIFPGKIVYRVDQNGIRDIKSVLLTMAEKKIIRMMVLSGSIHHMGLSQKGYIRNFHRYEEK
jgi:hypothetical protein